jgi:acetyltransferase-like isoleucine patch superfamily enzyme
MSAKTESIPYKMSNKKIASNVVLGENVILNDFINLYGCKIDDNTKIGPFVEVQKNAFIGKRCKISSHTFICEGVTIEDDVFVGHGVMFINDKYPKATSESGELQTDDDWEVIPIVVKQGASIGSNATLLCGITVGSGSIIGAGSVVTRDVPENTIVAGNPARIIRRV